MTATPFETANELVESHLHLVTHVVNQAAARYPRHVDRQELWAAGAAGLVDASRRYDPSAGVPFARYAAIRIRGAIIDSTRSRDWATRSLRRRSRELTEATRQLEQQLGRSPSTEELAAALEVDVDEIARRRRAAERATLLQLDQPVSDGEGGSETLESLLPEHDIDQLPEDALMRRELIGTMRVLVSQLSDPHREVVERYFFHGELLQDIAESLGVTQSRASQIRSEAVSAMRAWCATVYDGVPEVPHGTPGSRRRASYVTRMTEQSTWDERLAACDGHPLEMAASA
jgi:RNA polymerase sigma factor for flagellar operon FliA